MHLVFYSLPVRNKSCKLTQPRVVLHIFVSATTTLLDHILADPKDPLANSDLQIIEPLLRLLGLLSMEGISDQVEQMYESCRVLWERARKRVWESRGSRKLQSSQVGTIQPRPQTSIGVEPTQKESVEDFIKRIENISRGYEVESSYVT